MKKGMTAAFIALQIVCIVTGGAVSLILNLTNFNLSPADYSSIYSVVVLVLLSFIVIIEIGSAIKIYSSTIHTVFISCALFISYLFSYDMQGIINPSHSEAVSAASEIINFISYALVMLTHIYLVNFLYDAKIKKRTAVILIAYSAAACLIYGLLAPLNLQYIAYIVHSPVVIFIIFREYLTLVKRKKYDSTFNLIITILAAATGLQIKVFLNCCGVTQGYIYGIDATYMLIIIILYVCVYVLFLLRTDRDALKASEYKLQSEQMKSRLLREQINPHFIFNSLISVKEAYHTDTERGDMAMKYFSNYLRANVEAMDMDCIPFTKELDNIENYIGLVNMKRGRSVNIIYDIEYYDFSVPVLALQVFVENCVKYSKIDLSEDGFISITAQKSDGGIIVKVIDNGVGFDVNAIKDGSCGIKNAKTRFSLLLGADVNIESAINEGATVTITIPENPDGERQ